MMISPESYYEEHIRDKSIPEILTCISDLNQDIDELINEAEKVNSFEEEVMCPTPDTQLMCVYEYLQKAREELTKRGGTYTLSQRELTDKDFQNNIHAISKITIDRHGFFQSPDKRTLRIFKGEAHLSISHISFGSQSHLFFIPDYPSEAEEIFDRIEMFHLGTWKKHYTAPVCDGEQWTVDIDFSNGFKHFHSEGSNAYPPCFEELWNLLYADELDAQEALEDHALVLAESVCEYLSTLPESFLISTSNALENVLTSKRNPALPSIHHVKDIDSSMLFDIHDYVCRLAQTKGIRIDMSSHNLDFQGLPYNLSYLINHIPE